MIPMYVLDFTPVVAPFMLSAAVLAVTGVIATTVAIIRAERTRPTAPALRPRIEPANVRPAA